MSRNKYPFPRLEEDGHLKKCVNGRGVVYGVRKDGQDIKTRSVVFWIAMFEPWD